MKKDMTSIEKLLEEIAPQEIADKKMRSILELLLNLIEELKGEVKELREENQRLRDENNRLKGEQGKPEIKAKKSAPKHSSEKERQIPREHKKSSKNEKIKIDREEILEYPKENLPADAEFKGYQEVVIQDIILKTDNVLYRKEKYYAVSTGKTYTAELPRGYEGEFGPNVKALILSLYYGGNMTQGKLLEFLEDIGISISAGYVSNLLIKDNAEFANEKNAVQIAGLASSPWHHFDQTGARVKGVNHTTNVLCNPLYTSYITTEKKDRLAVLQALQNGEDLKFLLNGFTYELLNEFQVATKWQNILKTLTQEQVFTSTEFNQLLDEHLGKLGKQYRSRVLEAAAIAFYRQQTSIPVIQTLISDDAPQFKAITENLALCWVHEGRHYKKLNPVVACHRILLEQFLDDFWKYYRELLAYKDAPSPELATILIVKFLLLFDTITGYEQLDDRKRLTAAKSSELLQVLLHPELPLHNNPAELAARTMVQRRNISYATQTTQGTDAWDIFMSLVDTTRKLGISFFAYIRDRISSLQLIPSLDSIIADLSSLYPLGSSWLSS
jgi:regulator of replication initiation timing